MASTYNDRVFINCPFDQRYVRLFRAIVFAVHDSGFVARCALEVSDATQNRFSKIVDIIESCRYGIHDLSRTQLSSRSRLPRFNMPLELGLFLGAQRFGAAEQKRKSCLILEEKPYRYQQFVSDLAGHDVTYHNNDPAAAIGRVRDWLRTESRRSMIPGGSVIAHRYEAFSKALPRLCRRLPIGLSELTFIDYSHMVTEWLKQNAP